MLLRELFEQEAKHITFCFGRMNPPTLGHAQVFKTMASVGGDYMIFLSQTQDKKENPLSYEGKIKFIKEILPQYADHIVENKELNTVVKVATYLYDQGYRQATFVAGSDRLDSFKKLLTQYNGVEGKAHGYYNFDLLDFESSGDRDPDSGDISGISASKARAAAANNNFNEFKKATGAGHTADEMFVAVRAGLGITESIRENKMRAKDFIPPSKPRNPVVRQQQTSGAGVHKDKKKAQKQGDTKHKKKMFDEEQGTAEDYNPVSWLRDIIADLHGRASAHPEKFKQAVRAEVAPWANDDPEGFEKAYKAAYDSFYHVQSDQEDDDYTDYTMRQGERGSPDRFRRESGGDEKFDNMMKSITNKRAVNKQKKADNQQRSQDAFNNMFGGDADFLTRGLNIRKKNVKEGGIDKTHISPSGVKTNMPPTDDDYAINYGKNGLVAKDRKARGVDVATGNKRAAEGSEPTINIGDDVVIIGNSAYAGVTGRVIGFREGKIVVDMLEQGKVRFAPERVKLYTPDEQGVAEISKPAMARYVKAASKDVEQRASSQSFASGKAGDKYNKADPTHKDTRREKGIDRALGRLSK